MNTPNWTWQDAPTLRGKRLVLSMPDMTLQSAALAPEFTTRKTTVDCWKSILLDRYHRIKDGKAPDGITQLDSTTYQVAGLL